MRYRPIGIQGSYFVKLNSLDLQCFHRGTSYNEVWETGSHITLFSPSSQSIVFPVSDVTM